MAGDAAVGPLASAFGRGRAALIIYLMGGYPDRATSLAALHAASDAGADVVELGVPYGDPLADGPVIALAGHAARAGNRGGFGLPESIELAREFLGDGEAASKPRVALMTYFNPMLSHGLERFARDASAAGISGVIVPDLPPDSTMAEEWREHAASAGVDTVFLVAPTSTRARIETALSASTGFVYCVSTVGITGERTELPAELADTIARVRAVRDVSSPGLAVAVGFGISTPEQAAAVARLADGVIVGTAAVRRQRDPEHLRSFVDSLSRAVRSARS